MQNSRLAGLRDRKKIDTAFRVQRVAIELAISRGSDAVTVDEICAGSDISVRTFFNYFPTKETAILGRGLELIGLDEIRRLLDDHPDDTLRGVVAVLERCFSASEVEPELLLMRKTLMEAEPQLVHRQLVAFDRFEGEIARAVAEWLHSSVTVAPSPHSSARLPVDDEAHLTVLLAGTVMRRSVMRWVAGGGQESRLDLIESTIDQLARITIRAQR
jgi:AcrR family transcriptional regulator